MSQFITETGMAKNTIVSALRWLEANGYIWSVILGKAGMQQKVYALMSENTEAVRNMVQNKMITEKQFRKMIQLQVDRVKYRKSVKLGTFLDD